MLLLFAGVQNASGEYLVGGHLGFNQEVHVAEAKIVYRHPNKLSRDVLTISGRTNFPLRVMVKCFQCLRIFQGRSQLWIFRGFWVLRGNDTIGYYRIPQGSLA